MATKRIRMRVDDDEEEEKDRLSELPDEIIHKILSFLPTVIAVKMSVVSKRWRHLWISDRSLYFEECLSLSKGKFERKKFMEATKKCMKLKLKLLHNDIDRFKLCMRYTGRGKFVDDWLTDIVRKTKVKEIHISVVPEYSIYKERNKYCLTHNVLLLGKSLTVLHLESLVLKGVEHVELPSLKVASLLHLTIEDDESLVNLLKGCPRLEDLLLRSCDNWKQIAVSHSNIKAIRIIDHDENGESIRVEAVNLESFVFDITYPKYDWRWLPPVITVDITAGGRLKSVSLTTVKLHHRWLQDLFMRHPQLEQLSLDSCSGLKYINNIQPRNLKVFVLSVSRFQIQHEVESIEMDAPNLVYFRYQGQNTSLSNSTINAPKLKSIHIHNVPTMDPPYFSPPMSYTDYIDGCGDIKIFGFEFYYNKWEKKP